MLMVLTWADTEGQDQSRGEEAHHAHHAPPLHHHAAPPAAGHGADLWAAGEPAPAGVTGMALTLSLNGTILSCLLRC